MVRNTSTWYRESYKMMVTPCIYYAILDKWNSHKCLKLSLAVTLGSVIAILLSLTMLCIQIGSIKEGFTDGVEHVIWSFGRRTYGNAEDYPSKYAGSLKAGTFGVVTTYFNGVFFDLNNHISHANTYITNYLFKIRYYYLIIIFLVMSILLFFRTNVMTIEQQNRYNTLIWTTWFSILAPLSWFVIFKAHSHVHTHMNFLLWQMPFTLFGFAIIGTTVPTLMKAKQSLF